MAKHNALDENWGPGGYGPGGQAKTKETRELEAFRDALDQAKRFQSIDNLSRTAEAAFWVLQEVVPTDDIGPLDSWWELKLLARQLVYQQEFEVVQEYSGSKEHLNGILQALGASPKVLPIDYRSIPGITPRLTKEQERHFEDGFVRWVRLQNVNPFLLQDADWMDLRLRFAETQGLSPIQVNWINRPEAITLCKPYSRRELKGRPKT